MELYIIRHGQSANNALIDQHVNRVDDPSLTEVGFQQADYLAQHFKHNTNIENIVSSQTDSPERKDHHDYGITHLYCSAMYRAMQTAKPMAQALGLTPHIQVDIHEHGGVWLTNDGVTTGHTGMTRSQVEEEFAGYVIPDTVTDAGWWNPADGKEDVPGCHARAMRVVELFKQRAQVEANQNDKIAIVTHGNFIDSLLKAFVGRLPAEDYFHWHYNTGITRLDFWNNRVVIRYINRISHLPSEIVT